MGTMQSSFILKSIPNTGHSIDIVAFQSSIQMVRYYGIGNDSAQANIKQHSIYDPQTFGHVQLE